MLEMPLPITIDSIDALPSFAFEFEFARTFFLNLREVFLLSLMYILCHLKQNCMVRILSDPYEIYLKLVEIEEMLTKSYY